MQYPLARRALTAQHLPTDVVPSSNVLPTALTTS